MFGLAFELCREPQRRSPAAAAVTDERDVEEALERQGKYDRAFELETASL